MRLSFRATIVGLVLIAGWFLAHCGDVTVSDLNPADFVATTPTPTPSPTP